MRTQCKASHLMISFIDSVVYVFLNAVHINVEFLILTVDGLTRFFRSSLMIAAAKKTYLKDKAEGSWLKKRKVSSRDVANRRR